MAVTAAHELVLATSDYEKEIRNFGPGLRVHAEARGLECLGLLAPREVAMKKILAHGFALVSAPSVIMYYQRAYGLHRRRC
jgi:hypothetical protein